MSQRIAYQELAPNFLEGLLKTSFYIRKSGMDPILHELINFRISQINGCAYCLDMHYQDAIHLGETPKRLYSVAAWPECPFYTDQEKAALAYAEAVNANHVEDEVYEAAARFFTKQELADITLAVISVSSFNKLNKTFRVEPSYQLGQHG